MRITVLSLKGNCRWVAPAEVGAASCYPTCTHLVFAFETHYHMYLASSVLPLRSLFKVQEDFLPQSISKRPANKSIACENLLRRVTNADCQEP